MAATPDNWPSSEKKKKKMAIYLLNSQDKVRRSRKEKENILKTNYFTNLKLTFLFNWLINILLGFCVCGKLIHLNTSTFKNTNQQIFSSR